MKSWRRRASLVIVCAAVAATWPLAAAQRPPTVAAAADLNFALTEIATQFAREHGQRLELVFGSSGVLARQIRDGAPFELFLSADETFVEDLADAGLTRDRGTLYAVGRIVLFAPAGSPLRPAEGLDGLARLLAAGRVTRFAIANPEHAPYGVAAREVLESTGLLPVVQGRLVYGENVAQALQLVQSGNADAGIVALPVVIEMSGVEHRPVDPSLHEPLRQAGAVLRDAVDPFGGERFLEFIMSDRGQEILRRFGFEAP
jgi:molybdate transport system substrate-binding protein